MRVVHSHIVYSSTLYERVECWFHGYLFDMYGTVTANKDTAGKGNLHIEFKLCSLTWYQLAGGAICHNWSHPVPGVISCDKT